MRLVFMGTPDLAVVVLNHLVKFHEVVCVCTRPDAARKRGNKLVASPVKRAAQDWGIPVLTPTTLTDPQVQQRLAAYTPDVICVAAYGALLPSQVLALPPFGCLNVHTSLLPRWRGAAPIERAILAGDEKTGVCIMRMEEGLDTGPWCVRESVDVGLKTTADLTQELAERGAQALVSALERIEAGKAVWTAQDTQNITYAEKIAKGELDLCAKDTVYYAARKVRAASAAHSCHVRVAGRLVSLKEACVHASNTPHTSAPSDIRTSGSNTPHTPDPNTSHTSGPNTPHTPGPLSVEGGPTRTNTASFEPSGLACGEVVYRSKQLLMGMSDGVLRILRLQPAGKKEMDAIAFASGIQGIKGATLTWEAVHE